MWLVSIPVQAKGPADRLVISSSRLDEDIVVTDSVLLSLLSWEYLIDLPTPLAELPQDIGDGYEILREYRDGDSYHPFDQMVYYPSQAGQSGYVFFEGIVNGSSEYDGKWFAAKPEGEAVIQRLVSYPNLNPYVVVFGDHSELTVLDAVSLEPVQQIAPGDMTVARVASTADGRGVILSSGVAVFQLDLTSGSLCEIREGNLLNATVDGQHLLIRTPSTLELWNAGTFDVEASISLAPTSWLFMSPNMLEVYTLAMDGDDLVLTPFDTLTLQAKTGVTSLSELERTARYSAVWDVVFGVFYLTDGVDWWTWDPFFHKLSPSQVIDLPAGAVPITAWWNRLYLHSDEMGGILVVDRESRRNNAHWQPERDFSRVIAGGDSFYAIEGDTLFRLDKQTGDILAQAAIPGGMVDLAYVYLDMSDSGGDVTAKVGCP
jgi:hypothetical protein